MSSSHSSYSKLSIGLILTLLTTGCGGADALRRDLKEAQREREVLRDAYESQQVRLRELESRLLQLEDGSRNLENLGSSQRDRLSARSKRERSDRSPPSRSIARERLRALPVVMVKRDLPVVQDPPPREDQDKRSKNPKNDVLSRPSKPIKRKERAVTTTIDEEPTPTLSAENIRRYQAVEVRERPVEPTTTQAVATKPTFDDRPQIPQNSNDFSRIERAPQSEVNSSSFRDLPERPSLSSQSGVVTKVLPAPQTDLAASLLEEAQRARSSGQREVASRTLRRMIAEFPTHSLIPEALYQMGILQIEQGSANLGRSTLLRLSRLYPKARAAQAAKKYLEDGGS